MTDQNPATVLRAAAAKLRELAADIEHVPTPWVQPPFPAKQGCLVAPGDEAPILVAFWGGVSEYVAALPPAVALALVPWLEEAAEFLDGVEQTHGRLTRTALLNTRHAQTVARAVLGVAR